MGEGRERGRKIEGKESVHELIKNGFVILLSTVHIIGTSSTQFKVIYLYKSVTNKGNKTKVSLVSV